ncbi:MAG: DUF2961 domain-containing protein [Thermoguttaceae bacterium]
MVNRFDSPYRDCAKQQLRRAVLLLAALVSCLIQGIVIAHAAGTDNALVPERLPVLRNDITVGYVGSIDKYGGNADNWWELYEENGESVLLDLEGPGCILSFLSFLTQETTFKVFIDGETTPRLVVRKQDFGKHTPFVLPWADDCRCDAGGVRRSFYPIVFKKSCKITSSIRHIPLSRPLLWGFGGVTYQQYRSAAGVESWTPSMGASRLDEAVRRLGSDPKPVVVPAEIVQGQVHLAPGQSKVICEKTGTGYIGAITMDLSHPTRQALNAARIRIAWDGEDKPSVDCPLGVFFGNELGPEEIRLLMLGLERSGDGNAGKWRGYNFFPMPYWKSARVEIVNAGGKEFSANFAVRCVAASAYGYEKDKCGYFHVTYRDPRQSERGKSQRIGRVSGRGRLVAAVVTAHTCSDGHPEEGDVHVTIDGNRSPRVESDGSESWILYGPGFLRGPQSNPFSGYASGAVGKPWSMVRQLLGDDYPFQSELTFDIEHGCDNQNEMVHSGALFYYSRSAPGIVLTDSVDIGNEASEKAHAYRVEGAREGTGGVWRLASFYEREGQTTRDDGRTITGHSEFKVTINPANDGVRLRRRFDQALPGQRARVWINGVAVAERPWYYAGGNPMFRWRDEDFEIPPSYTRGKSSITVRIENAPLATPGRHYSYQEKSDLVTKPIAVKYGHDWTEAYYWVYSYVPSYCHQRGQHEPRALGQQKQAGRPLASRASYFLAPPLPGRTTP